MQKIDGISLQMGSYVNNDGEEKQFLVVSHPGYDRPTRLLNKKHSDGTRMNAGEMLAWMKKNAKDWRERLEYVENQEYSNYFALSMVNYEMLDI